MVAIVVLLVLHAAAKQWYVLPVQSVGWQTLLPEVLSVPLFALAMLIPSLIVAVVLQHIPTVGWYLG